MHHVAALRAAGTPHRCAASRPIFLALGLLGMSFALIDSEIIDWVNRHNYTLVTRAKGSPENEFRAVYLSSKRGECCQIWIEPPQNGQVAVNVADVESIQDAELKEKWVVSVSELGKALEDAVTYVQAWFKR